MKLLLSIILCLFACQKTQDNHAQTESLQEIPTYFAKHLKMYSHPDYLLLQVISPYKGSKDTISYYLSPQKSSKPNSFQVPLTRIGAFSTTYLPWLDTLDLLSALKTVQNPKYINNPNINRLIKQGKIGTTGEGGFLNAEELMTLQLDGALVYSLGSSDRNLVQQVERAKVKPIIIASYLEQHPLGRLEWIRFVARFFNKGPQADSIFQGIRESYEIQAQKTFSDTPSVFIGAPWKGNWFVPGGQSYMAKFLSDAGASYLWQQDSTSGSFPLQIEEVYTKAQKADYWLHAGNWKTQEQLLQQDQRFSLYGAFSAKNIWNHNKISNVHGGDDFFETGSFRPDLLLQDLQALFHPKIFPDHKFIWYYNLK